MTDRTQPLRIALLAENDSQPNWITSSLRACVDEGLITISAVVLAGPTGTPAPASRFQGYWRNRRSLPYAVFNRMDVKPSGLDPFAPDALSDLWGDAAIREVIPRRTKFSDYFEAPDVEWLREQRCDVGLRLGFRILRGDALTFAPMGVWSFHHGDNRHFRGGPAGFWEVVERAPYTGAILQVLSEDLDGGRVLYRTCVPTHATSVSVNRRNLYWAAAAGLRGAFRQLQHRDFGRTEDAIIPYGARMYGTPTPEVATRAILTVGTRRLTRAITERRKRLQWQIGIRFDKQRSEDTSVPELSPHRWRIVDAPPGSLWADPFVVKHEGENHVFFEEIPPGGTLGRISHFTIDSKGQASRAETVLEEPFHLSYPCMFKVDDKWYMLPESFDAGRMTVYEALDFPRKWQPVTTLLDGDPLVDPTVFEHEGMWWMFGSRPTPQTLVGEELYAYFAEHPLGTWTAHPLNPLRAGSDGSRPAGKPFRFHGRLIRPGQHGAPRYGAGVRLFEIKSLTRSSYHEEEVADLFPTFDPKVHGLHTVNACGQVTVGDLLIDRRE